MIIKNFLKDGVIYGVGGTIAKFTGVLTAPVYIRFLDTDGFGELDLATTITAILVMLTSLEIHSGYGRSYYESKKKNELNKLTGSVFFYTILAGATLIISAVLIYLNASHWFDNFNVQLLLPIAANVLPINLLGISLVALRFEKRPKSYIAITISNTLLTGLLGIAVVVLFDFGVVGILWANTIVSYFICFPAVYVLYKVSKPKFSVEYVGETLKYGAPLTPARIGSWLQEYGARFFIIGYLSYSMLGVYALALKVALIIKLVGSAFNLTWNPLQIELFDKKNSEEKFSKAINYYMLAMFLGVVLITSFSPILVAILATSDFYSAISLIGILSSAYFWDSSVSILSTGNSWRRKTYYNSLGSIIAGMSVLLMLWVGIEEFGLLAAAISFMVGSIIKSILILITSQYNHIIPYSYRNIGLSLLLSLSFSLLSYGIYSLNILTFLLKGSFVFLTGILHFLVMYKYFLSSDEKIDIKKFVLNRLTN